MSNEPKLSQPLKNTMKHWDKVDQRKWGRPPMDEDSLCDQPGAVGEHYRRLRAERLKRFISKRDAEGNDEKT